MPEIYLYGTTDEVDLFNRQTRNTVKVAFKKLSRHYQDAVLICVNSTTTGSDDHKMPFVRVEGSVDMSDTDLIAIANHFVETIDVSVRNGLVGIMVFREKGQEFEQGCLKQPPHNHPRDPILRRLQ